MNHDPTTVIEGLDRQEMSREDIEPEHTPTLNLTEEPGSTPEVEVHKWHHPHDRAHVDLRQEEYTPDEVARMLGTSLEVVMHAIWNGELKARRRGHGVVCIPHERLTEWLVARGSEL